MRMTPVVNSLGFQLMLIGGKVKICYLVRDGHRSCRESQWRNIVITAWFYSSQRSLTMSTVKRYGMVRRPLNDSVTCL